MDDRLSEELVERMMPALRELANRVGYGDKPDSGALKSILARAGLAGDKTALDEMESWGQILQAVHDVPDDSDQTASAIASLQERGVSYAPAALAVEHAGGKPLTCEPDAVDLGPLKPGELANETLTVIGRLSDVQPRSKRISVALHRMGPTRTLVKIVITPGVPGESLSDELVLRGEGVEISVPVTARWAAEQPKNAREEPEGPQPLRVCPTCDERGLHGEGSLFWNWRYKKWGCLNTKCPDFCLTDGERRRR